MSRSVYELIKTRRSIRKYRTEPVSPQKLSRILTAASGAPSGANQQPWLYILVDDPLIKKQIRAASEEADQRWNEERPAAFRQWLKTQQIPENSKPFLTEAPLLLCAFGDNRRPYWQESTWLSIAYLLLAVEEEGLSTITYTPGYPDFLNGLLDVPPHFVPQAILPLGYAGEKVEASSRRRKTRETYAFKNKYGTPL
jgi:nitroreductase